MKDQRIAQPACSHCSSMPMETATQIIPGPGGLMFANLFCAHCGCSIGVMLLGVQQAQQPMIVKPS